VQVAAASGGRVIAVDIDDARLEPMLTHGATAAVNSAGLDPREVRDRVREHAGSLGFGGDGWKIFECSGTTAGQETAYGLLGPAAVLAVVGFTREKVSLRLSNLMAFGLSAAALSRGHRPDHLRPSAARSFHPQDPNGRPGLDPGRRPCPAQRPPAPDLRPVTRPPERNETHGPREPRAGSRSRLRGNPV
jgi:NADPH:quinone reductase-like Zn-dependent oxidoreductase